MRPPSNGNISSRYGWRGEGVTRNFHHGLDIGWADGRTLVAPEDGQITHYGEVPGWRLGRVQIIRGVSGYEHWLAHTDHSLRGLGPVREGEQVSVMGDTGAAPGQIHVHWETRLNGERLDPEAWLARPAGGGSSPLPTPTEQEEDIMRMFYSPNRPTAFFGPGYYYNPTNRDIASTGKTVYPVEKVADVEYDRLKAASLYGATPKQAVTLTDAQLEQIADAAREGGAEAVKGLDFVVTTSVTAT